MQYNQPYYAQFNTLVISFVQTSGDCDGSSQPRVMVGGLLHYFLSLDRGGEHTVPETESIRYLFIYLFKYLQVGTAPYKIALC